MSALGAVRLRPGDAAVLAAGACGAYALKSFYAGASAEQLGFVLAPTAALSEALSGVHFAREAGAGYWSRERAYLIAPACAGLNFTIAAFASLLLCFTARFGSLRARAAWLAAAAALSLAVTPLANAARIALDLALRTRPAPLGLARADVHRAEGVAVYLAALWLLHAAAERELPGPAGSARGQGVLAPLAVYLSVALGVPWCHGAGAEPAFWRHAAGVVATAAALAGLVLALGRHSPRRRA